jgi:flagellar basal body-associated protein FliL
MNPSPSPSQPPKFEPGGDRIILVIVLIVVTALGGMLWSFVSRQSAPRDAPGIKARHLPPSEQPAPPPAKQVAVPPAPTVPTPR